MNKNTKDMLLKDGTWFELGLAIGALLGGGFVVSALISLGVL